MRKCVLPLVCLLALTSPLLDAQSPTNRATAMIEADGLRGWLADETNLSCVRNQAGTLTIGACAGWLRTDRTVFGDYAMTFEVRARSLGAQGFLGLLGVDGRNRRTELVVAVPVVGLASAPRRSPIVVVPILLSATGRTQAMKPDGEWNAYTVTRNRTGVHVLLNGVEIASSGEIRASDGWIGFRADIGELEVRGVQLRNVFPTESSVMRGKRGELVDGAYLPGNGVVLPKLVREVKPQYTRDAMSHQIEGTVLLECIVGIDGQISRATVIRSLDLNYGLDAKALEAARQWRFQPATRDDAAVPVWITIELSFSLKK